MSSHYPLVLLFRSDFKRSCKTSSRWSPHGSGPITGPAWLRGTRKVSARTVRCRRVCFFLFCFAPSLDWSMPPLSLAASLIVACGAEADVLDLCFGIRGEYRFGKDKAEALLAQEEGCAPSGEYWFASMCVSAHAGYTCTRVLYPLVPPCPQRSRTRVHVYPRFVPACSPVSPTF